MLVWSRRKLHKGGAENLLVWETKSKDHDLSVVLQLTVYVSMVCFPKNLSV